MNVCTVTFKTTTAAVILALILTQIAPLTAFAQEQGEPEESFTFSESSASVSAPLVSAGKKNALKSLSAPVSSSGDFMHEVLIDLPPGRLEMTPSLSLNYSSGASRKDSPVGAGWSFGAGSISRSTLNGFPPLKRAGGVLEYDDDNTVFDSPSGRIVKAVGVANGPSGAAGTLYIPVREHRPVFYEYQPNVGQGGMWIEHDPSGIKRYFGVDLDNNRAQILNELGTHAWLLLLEVDVNGNHISYDYHNIQDQDRTDRKKPQRVPVLKSVSWGGNSARNLAHLFNADVKVSDQDGSLDMLNGHVLLASKVDSIVISGPDNQHYWTYVLRLEESSDTGRLLLTEVRRTAPGERPRIHTFTYSRNDPNVPRFGEAQLLTADDAMPPIETKDKVYSTVKYSVWDPGGIYYPTEREAVSPPDLKSAHKFLDFDGDGDTDIIYHPAGLKTVSSQILFDRSFLQDPGQEWIPLSDLSVGTGANENALNIPAAELISQIGDIDGDFDIDGIAFPVAYTYPTGTGGYVGGDPGEYGGDLGDYCCSQGFWNRCGMVDPIPWLTGLDLQSGAAVLELQRRIRNEVWPKLSGGGPGPWQAGDRIYAPISYNPEYASQEFKVVNLGRIELDEKGRLDIPKTGRVSLWDPVSFSLIDTRELKTYSLRQARLPNSGRVLIVEKPQGRKRNIIDLGIIENLNLGKSGISSLSKALITEVDRVNILSSSDVRLPNTVNVLLLSYGDMDGQRPDRFYMIIPGQGSDRGRPGFEDVFPDLDIPDPTDFTPDPFDPSTIIVVPHVPGAGANDGSAFILNCLPYVEACYAGRHDCGYGQPVPPSFDDLYGEGGFVVDGSGSSVPSCDHISWDDFTEMPISIYTNQSYSAAVAMNQQQTLKWWPARVGHRVRMRKRGDVYGGQQYKIEAILSDFMAPLVDVNADGRADIVLLKYTNNPAHVWPTYKFLPRAYIAKEENYELDLDFRALDVICESFPIQDFPVTSSEFTESLLDILSGGHLKECKGDYESRTCVFDYPYPISHSFNCFMMDVNSDGLPDLVVARPPKGSSATPESIGRKPRVRDVQLHVARHFHLSTYHMKSSTKAERLQQPRRIAMYLAKQHTDATVKEIAREFGKEDEETVARAIKNIEETRKSDDGLDFVLRAISTQLATLGEETHRTCIDGHKVYLNHGYRWDEPQMHESWSSPMPYDYSDLQSSPLLRLFNRDRLAANLPYLEDSDYLTTADMFYRDYRPVPMVAMSTVDINSDGRLDIVFAYRQRIWVEHPLLGYELDLEKSRTRREVFLNTGRGFAKDNTDYHFPENFVFAGEIAGLGAPGWIGSRRPKPHASDISRFVDIDSDGLMDIVISGYIAVYPTFRVATWHRNQGVVPDLLIRTETESGAWTETEYIASTSCQAQLEGVVSSHGQLPPKHMVVKRIENAAGPKVTSGVLSSYRFPVETITMRYVNYVQDNSSSEAIGFQTVIEDHQNSFQDGASGETVTVTRDYDVQETVGSVPVRFPLKGLEASVELVSGANRSIERLDYMVTGNGPSARIRNRAKFIAECTGDYCKWSGNRTIEVDEFGNPEVSIEGNSDDGVQILQDREKVTANMHYDNRTNILWRIGLVTEEEILGYSQDVQGNPTSQHLLSRRTWGYDDLGRLKSEVRPDATPVDYAARLNVPVNDTTSYFYNNYGLIDSIRSNHHPSCLGTISHVYSSDVLYASATKIKYTRYVDTQPSGPQFLTESYVTDLRTGEHLSVTDFNNQTNTKTRDSHGRPLREEGPGNLVLYEYAYNDDYPVAITTKIYTDYSKAYKHVEYYDGSGNIVAALDNADDSPLIRREYFVHDAFGRAVESYLPEFLSSLDELPPDSDDLKTRSVYDGLDRPTQTVLPDGRIISYNYLPWCEIETNARGYTMQRDLDWHGRIIRVTKYGNNEEVLGVYSYLRDGIGNIVSIIDPDMSIRNFEYDLAGRIRFANLPHKMTATADVFEVAYDLDDEVIEVQTPENRTASIMRDELGRPLRFAATSSVGNVEAILNYDDPLSRSMGRLWMIRDESGVTTFTYDPFGRKASQQYVPSRRVSSGLSDIDSSYTAVFDYARLGHLRGVSFEGLGGADSSSAMVKIEYPRDTMGRPIRVESVADAGRVVLARDPIHDAHERLRYAMYGNDVSCEWTYHPSHQWLSTISLSDSDGNVWSTIDYSYDANENIKAEIRTLQGVGFTSKEHVYNALDRLEVSSIEHPSGGDSKQYEYSPGGNLTLAGSETYRYDNHSLSQAVTRFTRANSDVRQITYNKDGEMEYDEYSIVAAPGNPLQQVRSVVYDAFGRVREVLATSKTASGDTISDTHTSYIHGQDGRRIFSETVDNSNGATVRVIAFTDMAELRPDDGIMLLRIPLTGTTIVEEARSLADGSRVLAKSGYIHTDVRGSIIGITGYATGPALVRTHEAEYDAWGNVVPVGNLPAPIRAFIGHEPDPHTGYYSFGRRVYDPSLRRFISPDPLLWAIPEVEAAVGEQLNLYAYAGNNPVRKIDTSGLKADDEKKPKPEKKETKTKKEKPTPKEQAVTKEDKAKEKSEPKKQPPEEMSWEECEEFLAEYDLHVPIATPSPAGYATLIPQNLRHIAAFTAQGGAFGIVAGIASIAGLLAGPPLAFSAIEKAKSNSTAALEDAVKCRPPTRTNHDYLLYYTKFRGNLRYRK